MRKFDAFIIQLFTVALLFATFLLSCNSSVSKNGNTSDLDSDSVVAVGYSVDTEPNKWDSLDWVPNDSLKVKGLNTDQITAIYGSPLYVYVTHMRRGEINGLFAEEELWDLFPDSNSLTVYTYAWRVDPVRNLKMYCMKGPRDTFTPVYGFQYNINTIPFE